MNKRLWTHLVALVVGGGVGFLIAQKMLEEKYAKLAEEEIESVKEVFGRNRVVTGELSNMQAELNPAECVTADSRATVNTMTKSSLSYTKTNPYEQAKKNYVLFSKVEDEGPETDAAGMTEEDTDTDDSLRPPYLISSDEYTGQLMHHDKLTVFYYKPDEMVVDDQDDQIHDIDGTIGLSAIEALYAAAFRTQRQRNDSRATATVWVRNERLGADYEVIGVNTPYKKPASHIYEVEESPRERHERHMKTVKKPEGGRRKKNDDV